MKIRRRDFTATFLGGALGALCSHKALADDVADNQSAPGAPEAVCPEGQLRFQLLGSSAGKPVPRPFCLCPACEQARKKGGRDYRTRTSMNIYGPGQVLGRAQYRVDLSPDAMHHVIRHRLDETALEHLLFTHDHSDHCDPTYLGMRSSAVSGSEHMKPLQVYGGAGVEERIRAGVNLQRCKIAFQRVEPFQQHQIGGLTVHSLRANHGSPDYLNYIVQAEGLTVLLAWDTGIWSEETWEAASRFRFDAVFLECTVTAPGGRGTGSGHLNAETFLVMKNRMAERGMLKQGIPFVTVHVGDNAMRGHDQLQEYWTPHGVTVGYDGLVLDVAPAKS